ncbi:MAG TPA: aspartyl protease family protein [Tahibacter sp.]|uniref:aspartyl protease family protein n=1 Tax=Tahibacter sp. TaxID=2056211 RepID=UPI002C5707A7|nr:aspartyl protease family protein [Tahibacter sp.]HSX60966.1 aspartyl protease family protein [Tahibacter sp.]
MFVRALSLLLLLLSSVAAAAPDAAALLARARAVGGGENWNAVTAVSGRGTMKAAGLSGSVETREDVVSGRSVARYSLGLFKGANGYDGSVGWNQDPGGEVARLDAPEAQRQARTAAWLSARAFWFPQRGEADFGAPQPREHEGRNYAVVTATPAGGEAVELWFDAATGRLDRFVTGLAAQDRVVTVLGDWRDVDGVQLPFHQIVDRGADAANRIEIVYDSLTTKSAISDADFAVPALAGGAHIVDASGITRIPFRLVRDHIHVQAEVDGQPVQMLVDTGGVNILLPAAVKRLGLKTEGQLTARGTGEARADVTLGRAKSLRLGGVAFEQPLFYVIDFGRLPDVEGEDFDGVVGYELFQRFGVTIDYARRELVLTRPDAFAPPAGSKAVPFTMADRIPIVEGRIDGRAVRIAVDTGSGAAIDLHSPFVRKNDLKREYGATFEQISGWGVGGPMRAWPVRLGELEIGGFAMPNVAASLYTGDKGAFASPDVDANLGGRVLGRFTVAFDYANKRMHLAPNASYAEPFRNDRSGLALLRDGTALKVFDVTKGSPAQSAGLAAGDRIVRLAGEAVPARTLSQWRDRLSTDPAGTTIAVTYERDGKTHEATLVLADLIPATRAKAR